MAATRAADARAGAAGRRRSGAAVALDLGYDSVSAFIGMFRSHLGARPTQYLKSLHN
jgi:AraC-like DNA-binding protein